MRATPGALFCVLGAAASLPADYSTVPVVDLAAPAVTSTAAVAAALREYGFFYITNHGVPASLIEAQFDAARGLFALPAEAKRAMPFDSALDIGYLAAGGQALDEESGVGDTKEGFTLTNNGVFNASFRLTPSDPLAGAQLRWPPADALPEYEPTLRAYTAALTRVNHELNALLFAALGLGEADRRALASQPFTVTKQLRYAPRARDAPAAASDDGGAPRALGAGAHADWGALTILATDGTPGLEVEHPRAGWLGVPPRAGALIVNAGDQIAHWTNGEFRSANHRVVVASSTPRYSTAFFTYFDLHATVAPLPQFVTRERPPLRRAETTLEYFHFKLRESVGGSAPAQDDTSPNCPRDA